MCSLFGLIDFDNALTVKKKNKILNTLANVCECRGTDATGIAYNLGGKLKIYKRPVPAHKLNICVPDSVKTIMGHTRMTTQGSALNHNPLAACLIASRFLYHKFSLSGGKYYGKKIITQRIRKRQHC